MFNKLIHRDVQARLDELDLKFNAYGYDPIGISKDHLGAFYSLLQVFYRQYFRVECEGLEHIPPEGRAMMIGNHSGSLPADAGMVMASLFFDLDPPRYIHGMVEKFAQTLPFLSSWFSRIGQFTGLPEHAERLLRDDRLLLAFPEGARGIGKLYKDRYQLVRFGTGFMRIALKTRTPIVPFAYVGGEESFPAIYHSKSLAKLLAFHIGRCRHISCLFPCQSDAGSIMVPPMHFEGDGTESDSVIEAYVHTVRAHIAQLITEGRAKMEGLT